MDGRPDDAPAAARAARSRSGATRPARSGWPRCTCTPAGSAGWRFDIETATGARVAFLTRLGEGILPKADTVIQEGDLVHVVMLERDAAAIESQLGTKPEEL